MSATPDRPDRAVTEKLESGADTTPRFALGHVDPAQWIILVIAIVLAAYFIYLFAEKTDFRELLAILKRADIALVVLGFVTLAFAYVFRIVRLHFIVSQHSTQSTIWKCAQAILVGIAINNIYPFRLGDVYRVVAFRSLLGIDGAKMLGALVIERVIDLSYILMFLVVALLLLPAGVLPAEMRFWIIVLIVCSICAFILMLFTPRWLRHMLALIHSENSVIRSGVRFADSLLEGVASAVAPRSLLVILALSLVGWMIEIAALSWVTARAVGLESSYAAAMLGLVLGNLSTLFPNVPGYVGTFDYFTVIGITGAGGEANQAAAFAIVAHAMIWLFTTVCGLVYCAIGWYRKYWQVSVAANSK